MKRKDLHKRLKQYSAVAGATMIGITGLADAAVVYTNPEPDVNLSSCNASFSIDFNNDSTPDAKLRIFCMDPESPSTFAGLSIESIAGGVRASKDNNMYKCIAFASGNNIDGAGGYIQNRGDVQWWGSYGNAGQFAGQGEKFLGLKLSLGTGTHYGWIRVNVSNAYNGQNTVIDYAYNDTPGASILAGETAPSTDSDATLSAGVTVDESSMIPIPTTADTIGEKIDIFDFKITDGATSDAVSTDITQIVLHTSGNGPFDKVKWLLNGPDTTDVEGTYNSGANTLTFSGLTISVADGGNETYTLSGYFNTPTSLTDNQTFGFSIDPDTAGDLTVDAAKTQFQATQDAVSNGENAKVDITATKLMFIQQPSR